MRFDDLLDRSVVIFLSQVERQLRFLTHLLIVCSFEQKFSHYFGVSAQNSQMQRTQTLFVLGIYVGIVDPVQKDIHADLISIETCPMQRSGVFVVQFVYVETLHFIMNEKQILVLLSSYVHNVQSVGVFGCCIYI